MRIRFAILAACIVPAFLMGCSVPSRENTAFYLPHDHEMNSLLPVHASGPSMLRPAHR